MKGGVHGLNPAHRKMSHHPDWQVIEDYFFIHMGNSSFTLQSLKPRMGYRFKPGLHQVDGEKNSPCVFKIPPPRQTEAELGKFLVQNLSDNTHPSC